MNRPALKFRVWDKGQRAFVPLTDLSQLTDPRYEVSQFTGGFDTGKREIYEGDIVEFSFTDEDEGQRFTCRYLLVFNRWEFGTLALDKTEEYQPLSRVGLDEYEIIGNRFEHPHLLNNL